MPRFAEVDHWIAGDTLDLPAAGVRYPTKKVYRIPSPSASDGAWLQRLYVDAVDREAARKAGRSAEPSTLSDDDERLLYERCLGRVFDELVEDEVPWTMLRHMALTAFYWIVQGASEAEAYWLSPGGVKRPTGTTSTGTAAASTTR